LNTELKSFIVQQTQIQSMSKVAKMFGVSINNICRWKRTTERRTGAGRKVTNATLEKKLLLWLENMIQKNKGHLLTKGMIQEKARQWSGDQNFKASKGWLERFVKRNIYLNLHILLKMHFRDLNKPSAGKDGILSNASNADDSPKLRRSLRNIGKLEHNVSVKIE